MTSLSHFCGLAVLGSAAFAAMPTGTANDTAMPRIAIRDGHFVAKETGKRFTPLGANYYREGTVKSGKTVHAAFSPGFYDSTYVEQMMADIAKWGFNTVRVFHGYHAGEDGIIASAQSRELSPAYAANMMHFLRQSKRHGIHVIFTWDTWTPNSEWWSTQALASETGHAFQSEWKPDQGSNNYRLTLQPVRVRANAIVALIEAIRRADASLLPVVLAWELENEVHFRADQEPFKSRPAAFAFAGQTFDLSTDAGAQALMDTAATEWATVCAAEIHRADPDALVSASVFSFAAVGRAGPGNLSNDHTKDSRVPARPLALLRSGLDFVDLHIYGGKTKDESVAQGLQRSLDSVEMTVLRAAAAKAKKPLLIGETGVAANHLRQPPNWQEIHHDQGVAQLREHLKGLRTAGFAGVLFWHYGNPDSTTNDEFAVLKLFPAYGDAVRDVWEK